MVKHFKLAWYGLLALLVLLFIGLSAFNAESIDSVSIKLKSGVEEVHDKTLPLMNKPNEKLPDYKLLYLEDEQWKTIGTTLNTSAQNWIEYSVSDPPNLVLVQALRVIEEDKAFDDVLEEVQVSETQIEGEMFEYEIATTYSFKSGMKWFATTPLGIAIFGGIGLAVFLVVISNIQIG